MKKTEKKKKTNNRGGGKWGKVREVKFNTQKEKMRMPGEQGNRKGGTAR